MEHVTEFVRGDRVQARTGGPEMTVIEIYSPLFLFRYRCVWTDDNNNPRDDLFRREQLIHVHEPTHT